MFHLVINDNLELRQRHREDADEIFALIDCNRQFLRQWLPWLDVCKSRIDSLAHIESCLHQISEGTGLGLAIWERGAIVGLISYNFIDSWNHCGQLGYWLGEQYQGRGIMTASCAALIGYGFEHFGFHRQTIAAATGNVRSRAIAERLGFTLEGISRDAEFLYDRYVDQAHYGLLRRNWNATR